MTVATARIVVIEDNEVNAKLLAYQLRHLGYEQIQIFHQAQPALEWLQQHPCELVLTDCQMRPMDGYAFTRLLRKQELASEQHTLIIAVTADAMPHALQTCLDVGMDDYLVKPVQLSALQTILAKWLNNQSAHKGPCA